MSSRNRALAIAIQPVRDVFTAPNTTTDLLIGMSNARIARDPVTLADDTYTGAVFQNADQVIGTQDSITFTAKLKPPSSLPALNAFVLGRLLQAAKFAELRLAAAIGPEALGAWVDSKTPTLGASAAGTASLYKGYPLIIGAAAYKTALTAIRSYDAAKHAGLLEDWGSTPATNYTIPSFIGYTRDITSADPPLLSFKFWRAGRRYEMMNGAVTGLRYRRPTSTPTRPGYPEMEFTVSGIVTNVVTDPAPTIPPLGAMPVTKDGKEILDYKKIGVDTASIDFGLQTERPPNMNQADGADAPQLTGGTANGTIQQQAYLPSYLDIDALAAAGTYVPYFQQWGLSAGNAIQVLIPDARAGYPNDNANGNVDMDDVGLYIDVIDRNLVINFPF